MISTSDLYFYVVLLWGCHLHGVIAKADGEKCCCDETKPAHSFGLPNEPLEFTKTFNYSDSAEDIFRKLGNDSDITRTAETLDKGYYTSLCWSEIITLTEKKNGTNTVSTEYAITFETKSDIPKKYIKEETIHVTPEYKEFEIFDQATKKSQIVNFTTISKNDEAVVRQSRKMFCGSGPIYTREFTKWSESDRKRVEIKVSPKKQNLIANNKGLFEPNSYDTAKPNNTNAAEIIKEVTRNELNDNFNKVTITSYFDTSKELNKDPQYITKIPPSINKIVIPFTPNVIKSNNTPNSASNDRSSEGTLIFATNPVKETYIPKYSLSSDSLKGKVQTVSSNPNLADDGHDNQHDDFKPEVNIQFFDQKFHPVTQPVNTHLPSKESPRLNFTTRSQKDITVTTKTIMAIISNNDSKIDDSKMSPAEGNKLLLSTKSLNSDDLSQTTLEVENSTPRSVATTPTSDYDDDFSDELGEIKKDFTKSTDCSTNDFTEKLTTVDKNVFVTSKPDVTIDNSLLTTQVPTDNISHNIVGFGGSVNRIALEDPQNPNDNTSNEYENKPDTFRNSTEIVLPTTDDVNAAKPKKQLCYVPRQKIMVHVKISMDYNLESTDPSNYYSYSFPIMGLEKKMPLSITSINETPKLPDEIIDLEWSRFINDLGTHFFAFNSDHVLNFTQLVSQYLNSTTPESELDNQILPEETVKRLQGIKDYLKLCKTLNNKPVSDLGVTPQFRFSGELGHQGSVPFNRQDYGFYNYLLSPQYNSQYDSKINYPVQLNNNPDPYIKDYSQATFNLGKTENYPELLKKLQMYYYLPQQFNNRNWVRNNPLSLSPALSSSYNNNFGLHQNTFPTFQKESCPGCKTVKQVASSLDQVLSQLRSFMQSKKNR